MKKIRTAKALTRILAAEDDPDIQLIIEIALEDLREASVKFCSTGKQLLESIDEFGPELILLDVMMPVMDGLSTLVALRHKPQYAHIPIILMTAKAQSSEIAHLLSLGASQVITKPFDPLTLADELQSIWQASAREDDEMEGRLRQLQESYSKKIAQKIDDIIAMWHKIESNPTEEHISKLQHLVHNMAGSAATFGFMDLGRAASAMEKRIESLKQNASWEEISQPLAQEMQKLKNFIPP